ncbi:hypothetical protein [Burkholderia cepacia]|uniref:hypothetical protein n=1 Tax=Burkholderia cepacia TaxID=292 RepID=UPI001CF4511C|nr:hypothetical protein [Burkholderia cepacia]MCA8075556.1 hypothetical protein [Burkholderia cepacia]
MTQNEQTVTVARSPKQVAADLFRIGENPNLPAWQYPVLQQAIALIASSVKEPAAAPGGYCERAGGCVCGGDLPRVREGCSEWVQSASHAAPADEQAAFGYDDVVSICDAHGICLPVDCIEMVVEIVKLSGLLAARASSANETAAEAFTYASKQATTCASCGEHKHTPLRIDQMGGYVCLTCIDRELERSLELADDQRAAVEFALGVCAGHVAGERHVPALETLLSGSQVTR